MAPGNSSVRLPSDERDEAARAPEATHISRTQAAQDEPPALATSLPISTEDKTVISKRPPLSEAAAAKLTTPQHLGNTLVGKRLEHYELTEFVGGGGMGAVFRATDTRLGRTVAVKVLTNDRTDEETTRRFKNEAQSAARLDHPNIARVYYVGEDHGWNFIVFEFIEGINLRDHVERNGPLELEQALYCTLQVAEALAHSSSRDVVHRDIKPSNVLLTASGQVKLVDMGLARLHHVDSSDDDLTASGVTLGTFDYISPEQARDPRSADVRSDIYSLGCTLFFMLTGEPPFPDGTALQKLLRHNSDDPPDVRQFRPELHPRVSALLAKMLSKRPSQRQQGAEALLADIIALGQFLGLKSIAEFGYVVVIPAPSASQWRAKAGQILAAAAALVIAVIGMEIVLFPKQAGGDMNLRAQFKPGLSSSAMPDANTEMETSLPMGSAPAAIETTAPAPDNSATSITPATSTLVPPDTIANQPGRVSTSSSDATSNATESSPGSGVATAGPARVATAVPAEEKAKRIVVFGDLPGPPEPRTEFVSTLAEACARAADLGLSEVELRFSGPRIEQPFEVATPRGLTVRASLGYQPTIVFQPQVRTGEHHMIRLAGGSSAHLAMEGIALRMELPPDLPADGWSLFAISTAQSLDLTECVLTLKDGDANQLPIHDQVAMIAVQRRRAGETMTMTDQALAMGQQARINLERTIVRGEASLVSMNDETPLTVRWNQGLLATSKHLIETGGSATEPQYYEQIVLDLDNVTAYCRQGLYYLRRGSGKPYQFRVNAYADQCIFVTDPGAALFEMIGLPAPPELDELLSTGAGNRFSPPNMPFLFVRATAGSEPQSFPIGKKWSTEPRAQAGVPWRKAPAHDRPAHELTKADFEIEMDPSAGDAGFDPILLPDIAPPAASTSAQGIQSTISEPAAPIPPAPLP